MKGERTGVILAEPLEKDLLERTIRVVIVERAEE
jgi:hypothetical protein